jgi:hypothetical protein
MRASEEGKREQDVSCGRQLAFWRSTKLCRKTRTARVAQLVEHTLGKGEVIGSIPIASL